ncbi:MAG: hypothetical protein COW01_00360 [Bdellovibrionales bacterium CG12_big_fil_rev_8_21_14_0_65_38_15]|nr:MAG: hypothetical protein COW79_09890 [Bdellovibrionales bacterium CG22_combo_CG10-13_8_21_14_all_38_13]PIQ57420.1 MAG: hypothetical protein COW01_00360 [Bdellovibrionales bacterium CG12_big_fil_rev_8_21_14_0_65_38_15]PIR31140.1 MAG: hypothetical protein COV38_01840 [Bdellovibrionales bacterium CG11_big_fil_rev_8_21_14_0_20_38_13]
MKLLFSLLFLVSSFASFAQSSQNVVSQKVVTLPVDLNTTKLKFTNLGYGSFLVKVIVPELAADTLLNHRNEGEDGPCLFTYDAFRVDDVLQDNPEVVDTDFKITLTRSLFVQDNVCKVTLTESIEANIRGFFFQHSLSTPMPDRIIEDCF